MKITLLTPLAISLCIELADWPVFLSTRGVSTFLSNWDFVPRTRCGVTSHCSFAVFAFTSALAAVSFAFVFCLAFAFILRVGLRFPFAISHVFGLHVRVFVVCPGASWVVASACLPMADAFTFRDPFFWLCGFSLARTSFMLMLIVVSNFGSALGFQVLLDDGK